MMRAYQKITNKLSAFPTTGFLKLLLVGRRTPASFSQIMNEVPTDGSRVAAGRSST